MRVRLGIRMMIRGLGVLFVLRMPRCGVLGVEGMCIVLGAGGRCMSVLRRGMMRGGIDGRSLIREDYEGGLWEVIICS